MNVVEEKSPRPSTSATHQKAQIRSSKSKSPALRKEHNISSSESEDDDDKRHRKRKTLRKSERKYGEDISDFSDNEPKKQKRKHKTVAFQSSMNDEQEDVRARNSSFESVSDVFSKCSSISCRSKGSENTY